MDEFIKRKDVIEAISKLITYVYYSPISTTFLETINKEEVIKCVNRIPAADVDPTKTQR